MAWWGTLYVYCYYFCFALTKHVLMLTDFMQNRTLKQVFIKKTHYTYSGSKQLKSLLLWMLVCVCPFLLKLIPAAFAEQIHFHRNMLNYYQFSFNNLITEKLYTNRFLWVHTVKDATALWISALFNNSASLHTSRLNNKTLSEKKWIRIKQGDGKNDEGGELL